MHSLQSVTFSEDVDNFIDDTLSPLPLLSNRVAGRLPHLVEGEQPWKIATSTATPTSMIHDPVAVLAAAREVFMNMSIGTIDTTTPHDTPTRTPKCYHNGNSDSSLATEPHLSLMNMSVRTITVYTPHNTRMKTPQSVFCEW